MACFQAFHQFSVTFMKSSESASDADRRPASREEMYSQGIEDAG